MTSRSPKIWVVPLTSSAYVGFWIPIPTFPPEVKMIFPIVVDVGVNVVWLGMEKDVDAKLLMVAFCETFKEPFTSRVHVGFELLIPTFPPVVIMLLDILRLYPSLLDIA